MIWLKLYTEIVDDPKLRLLAFEDRWHYVAILCCKADGLLDEREGIWEKLLRVKLGLAEIEFDSLKKRLLDVCLIDDDWNPTGWDKRQSAADPMAAERQRRYREKHQKRNVTHNVTHNVTVTSRQRNAVEEEIEIEIEKEIPAINRGPSRKTSIPSDFGISDAVKRWAKEKGHTDLDRHLEHFTEAARAKGYQYVDWDAAFRKAITGNWAKVEAKPKQKQEFYI